jgi:1,4-alpha-glucan branching enzyme
MGDEFGQRAEWNANASLDWHLLGQGPFHSGMQRFVEDLNKLYRAEPGLWQSDYDMDGFFWVDCSDNEDSVLSFVRQNRDRTSRVLVILNLTPVPRQSYRVGVPHGGFWKEVLNSDAGMYGGSNLGNLGGVNAESYQVHNQPYSAAFTLPPMSVVAFKSTESAGSAPAS